MGIGGEGRRGGRNASGHGGGKMNEDRLKTESWLDDDNEPAGTRCGDEAWARFSLVRLERLLQVRDEFESSPEACLAEGAWKLNLLHWAIYSCYCGCVEQEVGEPARKLLHTCS